LGGYRREIVHRVLSEMGASRVGSSADTEEWVRIADGEPLVARLVFGRGGDLSTAPRCAIRRRRSGSTPTR
jgi:hypothetical protein